MYYKSDIKGNAYFSMFCLEVNVVMGVVVVRPRRRVWDAVAVEILAIKWTSIFVFFKVFHVQLGILRSQ